MTSKEPYTAAVGQIREATEKTTKAWKDSAKKFAGPGQRDAATAAQS
jgi:hypothetical protein